MTTIQLSLNNARKKVYLTGVDSETKTEILKYKQGNESINIKKIEENTGIICTNLLAYGDTNKDTAYATLSNHIAYFEGPDKGNGREIHYRDYSITEQKQKENAWIINRCSDKRVSVKSAINKIKEPYIFLWWKIDDKKSLI